jgi:hypothetical protein
MNQTLFTLPILSGKTEQARTFLRALAGERKDEFAACEQRLGVTKEVWAIQQSPHGDMLICYFAAPDTGQVGAAFTTSREEFDLWFNAQLAEITGSAWGGTRLSEIIADFAM